MKLSNLVILCVRLGENIMDKLINDLKCNELEITFQEMKPLQCMAVAALRTC
jgi:hypothetical protein